MGRYTMMDELKSRPISYHQKFSREYNHQKEE
jgi:hypothetical protein